MLISYFLLESPMPSRSDGSESRETGRVSALQGPDNLGDSAIHLVGGIPRSDASALRNVSGQIGLLHLV